MNSVKILAVGSYIPKRKITNEELEKNLKLESGYIKKRTGIKERYYVENEDISYMAIESVTDLLSTVSLDINDIELIIVATTTTNKLMPGISNEIQKKLKIEKCNCIDILAGCNGYITAFDIASMYIQTGKVEKALVVGVDILSKYTNNDDVSTKIELSEEAGATNIRKRNKKKGYASVIESIPDKKNILSCESGKNICMNGKEIYKYAVTEPVENIEKLIKKSNQTINDIKYIIPHQSNKKIIKAIANRLDIEEEKMYTNIQEIGNTFCASIPIALKEMINKNLLYDGDKIILLGYGGGLNTGSIFIEM